MRAGDMSEELHTELWLARISRQITEPTEQVTYNPVLRALGLKRLRQPVGLFLTMIGQGELFRLVRQFRARPERPTVLHLPSQKV
jgi:hypothetical protein